MQKYAAVAALAFISMGHAPALYAATISQAFPAPAIDNVPTFGSRPTGGEFFQPGTFINQFNPALGVLTSVSVSSAGRLDFPDGGSSDSNAVAIGVDLVGFQFTSTQASRTGPGVVDFSTFNSG